MKLMRSTVVFMGFLISCSQVNVKKNDAIHEDIIDSDTIVEYEKGKSDLSKDTLSIVDSDVIETDTSHQLEANNKLQMLLKYFGDSIPNYYSGSFVDVQGNLILNLNRDFAKNKAKIIDLIGEEKVLFETKTFSQNELIEVMEYLNAFALKSENSPYMTNVSSWSLMEKENYIEVCFIKMTREAKEEFKENIINSKTIRFQECGRITE